MKLFSKTLMAALVLAAPLCAQEAPKLYVFKNGQTIEADKLKLVDNTLVLEKKLPGGGVMETPYAIDSIAQIDFPEPADLTLANQLMADGKAAEAGLAADRVMRAFDKFRKVSGSYWVPAALVRIQALSETNRVDEARALVDKLSEASDDPNVVLEGKLAVIDGQIKFKQYAAAQKELDALMAEVKGPSAARMWLLRGDINAAQGKNDDALMCYLRIPTIYPTIVELQPRAYMGAVRIYQKSPDSALNLRLVCEELVQEYPASPEAAQAKKILDKLP